MAYNKTKVLEAAKKYLNQGKTSQAIAEYQQILRHEPKDQVTLMTLGDLYVRQGETFQALEYFERLAQLYLADGFVTKAIAIYKKIAKLAPEETKPLERLAELYVQQGVMSEARPLYLQLAETHLRANRHQQAVTLLHKLLEAEPDNLRVQTRLAELYLTIGQDKEAAEVYLSAARRLLDRNQHAEAEKFADRVLKTDPHHPGALTLKARALAAAGKRSEAAALLESLPDLDADPEATAVLVDQYLQCGQPARAVTLARRVLERNSKSYELAYRAGRALLDAGELDAGLELVGQVRKAMMNAGDHERLAQALTGAAQRLPGRLEPCEWLVQLYSLTNDSFRLPGALAHLAEAALAAGDPERAKLAYEQLLDRNPEDAAARRQLSQVRARLGLEPLEEAVGPREGGADQPAVPLVEAKLVPAVPEASLDEETQRYVAQALTDVDLFSSYGLAEKAIALLESVLQRVPSHAVTLERLLDLYLGAGDDRRTAELAAQLEQIYLERGDAGNAERFSELRRRFQRAADLAAEEPAAPALAVQLAEPALPVVDVVAVAAPPAGESVVHEIDLSEEWALLSQQVEEAAAEPSAAAVSSEDLRGAEGHAEAPAVPPETEPVAEYELELASPAVSEEVSQAEAVEPPVAPEISSNQFLAELSEEFEAIVPTLAAPAASTPAVAPVDLAAPAEAKEGAGPLREAFEEFRAELGEMGAEEEDLETHYNLGIAYREMGLLEEAIGEFQKVAKANDKGGAFRYAMQCCTLLGLAFMEKGQPAIAVIWYERALQTPGLDQESILALRYDLGVAQELAGDREASLKSFSQVYAMNIDYRDVAERIASLGKRR